MKRLTLAALVLASIASAYAQDGKIGAPAPKLDVAGWTKGTPVKEFAKGQVYVVEFWATWCGPCKASIPHLTEMAKKFGSKVNFIGVSVYESREGGVSESDRTKVGDFVKEMGEKMGYNVAYDNAAGTMGKSWLEAYGQDGIPSAFIVDQEGRIAHVNHPMEEEFEQSLQAIVDGKYDLKAASEAFEAAMKAQREETARRQKLMEQRNGVATKAGELASKGDWTGAEKAVEAYQKEFPSDKLFAINYMAGLYFSNDESKAYPYLAKLADTTLKGDSQSLNQFAWDILTNEELKKPDFKVALILAKAAVAATKVEDPNIMDTLGLAYWKNGDKKNAIEVQTRAVELAKKSNMVDPDTLKELEARLEMFKKG